LTVAPAGTRVELAEWALPIQQRHLRDVLDGSKTLAAGEDPDSTG
jgi:hypothetical protein